MKKKYTFLEKSHGVSTKVACIIREWANKNGHEEVDSLSAADYIYDTEGIAFQLSSAGNHNLHKITKAANAWAQLHSGYDVSNEELISIFNQINSKCVDSSRLGLSLMYRLRGDFYYDVQEVIRLCRFPEIKHCPEFETYSKIFNKSHNYGMYDPQGPETLPLVILDYIAKNGIKNKEIAAPFFNWIFKEFSITNNSTKIEIVIK